MVIAFMYPGISSCAIHSSDLSASIERTVPRAEYRCEGAVAVVCALLEGDVLEVARVASRGFEQSSRRVTSRILAALSIPLRT